MRLPAPRRVSPAATSKARQPRGSVLEYRLHGAIEGTEVDLRRAHATGEVRKFAPFQTKCTSARVRKSTMTSSHSVVLTPPQQTDAEPPTKIIVYYCTANGIQPP